MTKTIRQMQEDIKLVDLVIEIIDARVPVSSRNPDIDALASGKARLLILNKADLADEKVRGTEALLRTLCPRSQRPAGKKSSGTEPAA